MSEKKKDRAGGPPVRRRRVVFISGFDPRGARHYHQLWREDAPKAAASHGDGTEFSLGNRRRRADIVVEWGMNGRMAFGSETVETETAFDFLAWDDVTRELWPKAAWSFVIDTARTVLRGIAIGYFRRLFAVRRLYLLTLFQPVAILLAVFLGLYLAVAVPVAIGLSLAGEDWRWALLAGLLGILGLRPLLRVLEKGSVLWRGQLNNYFAHLIYGESPVMQDRIDRMAEAIADLAAEGGVDEFLVIGHSVGTTVAISAFGRALRRRHADFAAIPVVSFATLGSMTPLLAVEPRAKWFRDEIAAIAFDPAVTWVDIGAPYDIVCFPLIDPVPVAGHERPKDARPSPLMVTPRYHALFDAEGYKRLRADAERMHVQYLLATPKAGRCDFMALVAGPLSLKDRFPDSVSSKG